MQIRFNGLGNPTIVQGQPGRGEPVQAFAVIQESGNKAYGLPVVPLSKGSDGSYSAWNSKSSSYTKLDVVA